MVAVKESKNSAKDLLFLNSLNAWYQKEKRDLPWRRNPTPYNVWVSEIMLQQTQVRTVLPYYDKFLKRFPDFAALARAEESAVLAHWSGLGYYSRARNMHRCAQVVINEFGGIFPSEIEAVKSLPGIGPYTAGAILSIAFNKPHPILDGNVRRILSRIYLETEAPELWKTAERLIVAASANGLAPSDINQALMELGALVCLPSTPQCAGCPVKKKCLAYAKGWQDRYPPAKKKQETIQKSFNMYVIAKPSRAKGSGKAELLIRRRGETERWLKNMWEFPMVEIASDGSADIAKLLGSEVKVSRRLGSISHTITHHRLKIHVLEARLSGGIKKSGRSFRWVHPAGLSEYSSSSLLSKALALLN